MDAQRLGTMSKLNCPLTMARKNYLMEYVFKTYLSFVFLQI